MDPDVDFLLGKSGGSGVASPPPTVVAPTGAGGPDPDAPFLLGTPKVAVVHDTDAGERLYRATTGRPDVDPFGRVMADPELSGEAGRQIVAAGPRAYYDTKPILTPYGQDIVSKYLGPLAGDQIVNPLFRLVGGVLGLANAAGSTFDRSLYELGNALGGPRLGADASMGGQVVMALAPQVAGPRAGVAPPEAPPVNQGGPRLVQERFSPPQPYPGQNALDRMRDLIRHDEQWTNPDAPGYQANNALDARVLPPKDAPPPPAPDMLPPAGSRGGAPLPQAGPRVGGTPPGVIPTGLSPEQLAEHMAIPESLPPLEREIVTPQDAAERADQIVRHFAGKGNVEPIPGAVGALPTITRNSGLATLYRAIRDKDTPKPFTDLEDAAKTAHGEKLQTMAGTDTDLRAAEKARADTVDPLYKAAWANKGVADPTGAMGVVDDLMKSPLKQNDTAMAELRKIRKKLEGETDPEQLKGITDAIDSTVSELNTAGKADRYTRAALAKVDEAITNEISRVTPGFDNAQATFARLSQRINEMKYFQSRKLTDLQGNPTLAQVRSTIDDIRSKQAGDKFHPADSVTPKNSARLQDIHDQMQRESFTASAGKSLGGSNTFQNLATNSIMSGLRSRILANALGTGTGYLADTLVGGGSGVTGAVLGNIGGNVLQTVHEIRANQAAARQAAGEQMLMQALRERLMNLNNAGVDSLRRTAGPRQ